MLRTLFLLLSLTANALLCAAQGTGNLVGRVEDAAGERLPYASVRTGSMGTYADSIGAFSLALPEGKHEIQISFLGYQNIKEEVSIEAGKTTGPRVFVLNSDLFCLDAVVVSGSRTETRRTNEPIAVNIIDRRTIQLTQSQTIGESLCFSPGLRTETDCQTCNYTQIRMNGLGGAYSLLLIDGRPLVGSLFGLYGLEQLPAQMIDRIEVVRGGGSALYGAGAIAGTINLIPNLPRGGSWRVNSQQAWIGGKAPDLNISAEGSSLSEDGKTGIIVWGGRRNRAEYDRNSDGFSEIARTSQPYVGTSLHHEAGRFKTRLMLMTLQEIRDGGDQLDLPPHEREQSESRATNWSSGTMQTTFQATEKLAFVGYGGASITRRTHYTGTLGPEGYGNTKAHALQGGLMVQGKAYDGRLRWLTGIDHLAEAVDDRIDDYAYRVNQLITENAAFAQAEIDWGKLTLQGGLRVTLHNRMDGLPLAPRLALLWKPRTYLQLRGSYGRGWRPPQAFSADLHIAFAGGGVALTQIDPQLKAEWADSWNASVDWQTSNRKQFLGLTLTGFYTTLKRPFVLTDGGTDTEGNQILFRTNGPNQVVAGASLEMRVIPLQGIRFEVGMTSQISRLAKPVAWSEEVAGFRDVLRTPQHYGYAVAAWEASSRLTISTSCTYTGRMYVPHFGGAPENPADRLVNSTRFWAHDVKVAYLLPLTSGQKSGSASSRPELELSCGMYNLWDAYQRDFDSGPSRDSNFVYGPARPRTFWVGLSVGKF